MRLNRDVEEVNQTPQADDISDISDSSTTRWKEYGALDESVKYSLSGPPASLGIYMI